MKEKYIVITSIFPPTKAVRSFSRREDLRLIVVGDKKSPATWKCEGAEFLSLTAQEQLSYRISKILPLNHYSRKMIGYIYAIRKGAVCIIDTDDDNEPKKDWGFPSFHGTYAMSRRNRGFINIYKSFTDMHIWPRGFPLNLIAQESRTIRQTELRLRPKAVEVGVWQGLADDDPDVDAIYRLTSDERCFFREAPPIVLTEGTVCPFNSQNTAFRKEVFALLYLPSFVNFRFTDILRGLVAQPIMWLYGYHLGFLAATVVQKRNPHNYMKDFESEIPVYLHSEAIIEIVRKTVKSSQSLKDNLWNAYEALCKAGIVLSKEMKVLTAWIKDME